MKKLSKKLLVFSLLILFSFNMKASRMVQVNGELTGAGSKYSVKALVGFIHNREVLPKEKCSKIILKKSDNPKISDITKVEINGEIVEAHQFDGFVVQE